MKCSRCGKNVNANDLIVTDYGFICKDCFETGIKTYHKCLVCGTYTDNENMICNSCESGVYVKSINSYSTKPKPIFKNYKYDKDIPLGKRYYGLELEYSNTNSVQVKEKMLDLYKDKWLYNKSDGSLSDGVEIVTSPCDYKSIMWLLDKMKDPIKNITSGTKYTQNAGIHIHVSRKSIPSYNIYKLSYLLNNKQAKELSSIMFYLSGRNVKVSDNYLGRYARIGDITEFKNETDRYLALNLTNKHTIEFRIFKATNDMDKVKSYINFVESMIKFVDITPFKDINLNNYLLYLVNNPFDRNIDARLLRILKYKKVSLSKIENEFGFSKARDLLYKINPSELYKVICLLDDFAGKDYKKGFEVIEKFLEYKKFDINKFNSNLENYEYNDGFKGEVIDRYRRYLQNKYNELEKKGSMEQCA